MKFEFTVHTALDELRMQMLGTQVLFGFQLQGIFHPGFPSLSATARNADLAAFGLLVLTLGLLIAPAAQHRLVEKGVATRRIFNTANRFAEVSLATFAVAIGLDLHAIAERYWGGAPSLFAAGAAVAAAVFFWMVLGMVLRGPERKKEKDMPNQQEPELHEKIDQMLTEARVILPGAQALLGFQFVVTLTDAFAKLPGMVQGVHFAALGAVLLAVMLLISPAAVHRLAFGGQDAERMHDIGSGLITIALVPLAAGIAADVYVALAKAMPGALPLPAAIASFLLLASLWYALPLIIRSRLRS